MATEAGMTGKPGMTVGKSGPVEVMSGTAITYTLTVNNIGETPATDVKVIDTLPTGIDPTRSPRPAPASSCVALPRSGDLHDTRLRATTG